MKRLSKILVLSVVGLLGALSPAQAGWGGGSEMPTLAVGQSHTAVLTSPTTYHTFHFGTWASTATFLVTTYQNNYSQPGDDTILSVVRSDSTGYLIDDDGGPQGYSQAVFERRGAYEWIDVRSYGGGDLTNTKVVITRLK